MVVLVIKLPSPFCGYSANLNEILVLLWTKATPRYRLPRAVVNREWPKVSVVSFTLLN